MGNLPIALTMGLSVVRSVLRSPDERFVIDDDCAPAWHKVFYAVSWGYLLAHEVTSCATWYVGSGCWGGLRSPWCNVVMRTSEVVMLPLMTSVASGYVDFDLICAHTVMYCGGTSVRASFALEGGLLRDLWNMDLLVCLLVNRRSILVLRCLRVGTVLFVLGLRVCLIGTVLNMGLRARSGVLRSDGLFTGLM